MKFCVNCRYFQAPSHMVEVSEFAKCVYGMVHNPVTGERNLPTQSSIYAITVRKSNDAINCGPDARFFAEKEAPVKFPDLRLIP